MFCQNNRKVTKAVCILRVVWGQMEGVYVQIPHLHLLSSWSQMLLVKCSNKGQANLKKYTQPDLGSVLAVLSEVWALVFACLAQLAAHTHLCCSDVAVPCQPLKRSWKTTSGPLCSDLLFYFISFWYFASGTQALSFNHQFVVIVLNFCLSL